MWLALEAIFDLTICHNLQLSGLSIPIHNLLFIYATAIYSMR